MYNKSTQFKSILCSTITFIIVLITITSCSSVEELPFRRIDHKILFKITDLKKFLNEEAIDTNLAEQSKVLISGNTYKLSYEYNYQGVYLQTVVIVSPTVNNAIKRYNKFVKGIKSRYSLIQGVALEEISSYRKWGDESHFFIMKKKGKPQGNAITVRNGNKLYKMVLTGVYFGDIKTIENNISKKLAYLKNYEP